MEVDSFGDNLTIFINCKNKPCHHWMAYASWYSIIKNLPHATVKILVKRTEDSRNYYLWWVPRRNLNRYTHSADNIKEFIDRNNYASKPYLIIEPNVMAVKEFDEKWLSLWENKELGIELFEQESGLYSNVTSSEVTTFVYYDDFGDFVISDWINSIRGPFTNQIKTKTVNEMKVVDLWKRAAMTFDA